MGSSLYDIFLGLNLNMNYGPVSAKVNNKVEGLDFRLYHNKDVEFLDLYSPSGSRAYSRTLFFVLSKAVHDLFPEGSVIIDTPVSNGYYCDLRINRAITPNDVIVIRQRMHEIINADYPIRRCECTTEEAVKIFTDRKAPTKVKLLQTIGDLYTEYYMLDGYADYYYGALLPSTGHLHLFDLEPYFDGMLLRIPSTSDPSHLGQMIRQDKMFSIFQEQHRWQEIMGISTVGEFNEAVIKG